MQPVPDRIADRYELRSLLATGGMGQVWRAHDTRLGRDVALKLLRSEYTGDPSFLARFRAEARHTAVLSHPNIATLYDYGEVPAGPGRPEHLAYLVMELVDGESLSQLLTRERRLDPARAASVLRQTAAGLGAAHALGVVHRDVKPGNVLVAPDGTCKLTDFGIASSAASVPLTGTGQIIGTAHYLSPEQAQGAPATPASDVYALGLVGYEMLAGRRAFEGESSVRIAVMQISDDPPPLPADVPAGLRAVIEQALVKDPAVRFPDGATFRDAVDAVLAGRLPAPAAPATAVLPTRPISAPQATRVLPAVAPGAAPGRPGPPPVRPVPAPGPAGRSRRRLVAALLALAVLAVVAVVLALSLLGADDDAPGEASPTMSASGTGAPTSPTTGATTTSPSTTPTTAAPEPPTVEVVAGDLVGRPVADVEAELTRLGLIVQLDPVPTADVADGEVLDVTPVGELAPGDVVTVTYAVALLPEPVPGDDGDGDGDAGGGGGNGNDGGGNGNGDGGGGNGNDGGGNGNGNDGNQGNGGRDD